MDETSTIELLLRDGNGVILRRESRAAGVSDQAMREARRRGTLSSLTRGASCARIPERAEDHRALLSIAALRLYPDAQLSSSATVAAWGLPVVDVPVARLDLARPVRQEVLTTDFRIRPIRHERAHSPAGPSDPLPAALIQMAMDVGILRAMPPIDAALHRELTTAGQLDEAAAQVRGWPRSSRVTCALAWADGRSESPGETLTRAHLRAVGIRTTPQVVIKDPSGRAVARADLVVDGAKVIIEVDGKVKYTDGGADALFREKKREDKLRRLGYVVVRVVWADLYRPAQLIAAVRDAIETAA